jgi:hypothetical protein
MGSLIDELKRQEEAARAEADRLRARIEELAGDLARAEEQASRPVIARLVAGQQGAKVAALRFRPSLPIEAE